MRGFVLLIVLLLCVKMFPQSQAAEDERRFLGKESVAWAEVGLDCSSTEDFIEYGTYMQAVYYYSAGDTIFDGKEYTIMRMYVYYWLPKRYPETIMTLIEGESLLQFYIREDEDGCVWINLGEDWEDCFICGGYWKKMEGDRLLYDFSGDWENIKTVRTGHLGGIIEEEVRSYSSITLLNGESRPMANAIIYGIGGRGSGPVGLMFPEVSGVVRYFLSFYRDGELLLENTELREAIEKRINDVKTGISTIVPDESAESGAMYDLSGRRIDKKPAKGMYIQNGRKYVVR